MLSRYAPKVIPLGIDPATYPTVPSSVCARWQSRFPERFFLFVGALRYYKGLDYLIEACREVPYPVVILGRGPMECELKARVARLGLLNVHFVGALDDIDKVALLQRCHALVFPSHLRSEAFGISLLEAAMYGKPMISCEIGTGTTYVNIAGETGLVVPPMDASALAGAMTRLWRDSDMAAQMGQRATKRFASMFTAERMVQSYAQLYSEVLSRP